MPFPPRIKVRGKLQWESRLVPPPDKGIRGQGPTGNHLKPWIPAFAGNPGFPLPDQVKDKLRRNDNMEIGFEF